MTEHIVETEDANKRPVDEFIDELASTHVQALSNHEAYTAVNEATAALREHPILDEMIDDDTQRTPETTTIASLKEQSARIEDLLTEIDTLSIDLTQLTKRRVFKDVAVEFTAFTHTVSDLEWQELTSDECDQALAVIASMQFNLELRNQYFWGGEVPNISSILLHGKIPQETLQDMYHTDSATERTSGKSFLRDLITAGKDQLGSHVRAKVLADVYAGSSGVDKLPIGADSAVDAVRDELGDGALTLLSIESDKPLNSTPEAISAFNQRTWERMDEYLLSDLGLSQRVVDRFYYAANGRFHRLVGDDSEKSYALQGGYIARQLVAIRYALSSLSSAEVDEFVSKLGVVNLDSYNELELNTLQSLIKDDDTSQETLERLRSKDLTVVFADAFGDYNGAFTEVHRAYATPATEVIRFEIQRPSDFYRYMILLKERGIKPSNLVIAGHGAPGNTSFGTQAVQFSLSTSSQGDTDQTERLYGDVSLGSANLARLFSDEFMKPNKKGGRRIFLHSCSGAAEAEGVRSTAETILQAVARTDTTMYAATEVMSTSSTFEYVGANTQYGIKYLDHEARLAGDKESTMVELKLQKPSQIKRLLGRAARPLEMKQRKVDQAILSKEAA